MLQRVLCIAGVCTEVEVGKKPAVVTSATAHAEGKRYEPHFSQTELLKLSPCPVQASQHKAAFHSLCWQIYELKNYSDPFPDAVAKTSGSVLGVTVGCLLGMVPLLWMDAPQREAEKTTEQAD